MPSPLRILGLSLVIALAIGTLLGLAYAFLLDRVIAHGLGAGWFLVGLICLAIGLLGAVEPPEGWRRRPQEGRSSMASRLGGDAGVTEPTTLDMLLWAVIVGGGPIGLSLLAFRVAAQ